MRKEFKYGIGGLIFGFVFCFCLFLLVLTVSASEVGDLSEPQDHELVQDEQTETEESAPHGIDQEIMTADQPPQESEIAVAVVEDEQSEDIRTEPFASGVIVGELADLLQENVIENDGYTEESWQRYEEAVAAGWAVISNFMIYTNDEVRAVIDELKYSIAGLEYLAGKPAFPIQGADSEIIIIGLFSVVGSVAGSTFMNKWQMGV